MPYRCDHCEQVIETVGFDYVILFGGSNEARPELFYHTCCAITVLQKTPMEKCCETHWLESK
jgi:hypothetical protein